MKPVELLTVAGWHFSVGDIAVERATAIELAKRGVAVIPVNSPSGDRICVVGGGYVLPSSENVRPAWPGQSTAWSVLLSPFTTAGRHIVNAAGVHGPGDFSYLREYSYVSVRDEFSVEAVSKWCGSEPVIVPCPSVLLEPLPLSFAQNIPGWGFLAGLPYRDCVVIDDSPELRELHAKIPGSRVSVNTRPWRRVDSSKGVPVCQISPLTHSPELVLSLVSRARAVVSRSLHLCVFCIATGTPFVVPERDDDPQTEKIRRYLERCGLGHAVNRELRCCDFGEVAAVRDAERAAAIQHIERMVSAIRGDA